MILQELKSRISFSNGQKKSYKQVRVLTTESFYETEFKTGSLFYFEKFGRLEQ